MRRDLLLIASCLSFFQANLSATQELSKNSVAQTLAAGGGYALNFDGASDYVEIADNALLSGGAGKSITVEAWVKPDNVSEVKPVVEKFLDGSTKDWGLQIVDGVLEATIESGNDNWNIQAGSVPVGSWTHVAFAFDNSANLVRVFVNGVQVGQRSLTKDMPDTRAVIRFGRHGYAVKYLDGEIDEVRIWNYARTAAEISAQMNTELTGTQAGLIGYWPMNNGSGQTVTDVSGRGNNGRLGSSTGSDSGDPQWLISTAPLGPLPESLQLTKPNGGESWEVGSSQAITWNSQGNIADVNLEYSTDNGGSWTAIVSSTTNDGSYTWTIPDAVSSQVLVRLADAADNDPIEVSDAVFAIVAPLPPALTVSSPNGGDSWTVGSTRNITWSSQGLVADLHLQFSTDNGASWTTIVASTPNDGSYAWTIANAPSSQCLVRISDSVDGDPADVSDGVFTIVAASSAGQKLPDLKVWVGPTRPAGLYDAEIVVAGGQTRLRFANTVVNVGVGALELHGVVNSSGEQPAYQRIYYQDGHFEDLLVGVFVFAGHEDHNHFHFRDFAIYRLRQVTSGGGVGNVVATSDKVSFCITDSDEYDTTLPGAPQSHVYDCDRQGMSIGWGDRYGKTISGQWIVINNVSSGEYWLESEANPDRLLRESRYDNNSERIRISLNKTTKRVRVLSDLLTLTQPNGGEKWKVNSSQTIKWTSGGNVNNVKLEYSTNNGVSWATIVSSTNNDSSYSWKIPNAVSSNCLVRISDAADGNPSEVSDAVFSITASSSASSNVATLLDDEPMTTAANLPDEYRLAQNYPNPFNPETRIAYDLPQAVRVRLTIYDVLGRQVAVLVDEEKPAGHHGMMWSGRDANDLRVSSGVYFYHLRAGDFTASQKMLFVQ